MIAYPTHPCDALLESFERDRASSARLPRSLPVRVWGVCAVLLVAGMGVYCVRLEEVSAWPVRASIALPLIVMTVLAMSVATLASLKVSELLDCLKQLTAAIEAEDGEGTGAALSEHGPRATWIVCINALADVPYWMRKPARSLIVEPSVFWVGGVHEIVALPFAADVTVIVNTGSETVSLVSVTEMMMLEYVPAVAVPVSWPVVVLNVAQLGLFWMLYVSVSPSASAAVGLKL